MSFTFRTLPPWDKVEEVLPSSQMPSRDPMWYRVWMRDISGDLPTFQETEWLRPWMANAKPGDIVYLNGDHKCCDKEEADVCIQCDM